jgi:putative hydrolase of the HAD superfamily
MIRAVLFDFDGTLYDRDAAVRRTAEEQFDAFRRELGVEAQLFVGRVIELDAHGHGRVPHLHHVLARELNVHEEVADRLESYFRTHYPRQCQVSTNTLETLRALRDQGIKLGIVTNGPTEWQSRKLEATGIASMFDTVLISGMEGVEKPDPRIFLRALDRCGVPPSEAMFVGDHPVADIAGAKGAGLLPVWKRMPYWEVPDDVRRVDELSEILVWLGK